MENRWSIVKLAIVGFSSVDFFIFI